MNATKCNDCGRCGQSRAVHTTDRPAALRRSSPSPVYSAKVVSWNRQVRFADFVSIALGPACHRCALLHSLRALRTRQDDPSCLILVIPESDGNEAASIIRESLRQRWNHRWTRRGQAASREAKSQKLNHGFHGYHGFNTESLEFSSVLSVKSVVKFFPPIHLFCAPREEIEGESNG